MLRRVQFEAGDVDRVWRQDLRPWPAVLDTSTRQGTVAPTMIYQLV